MLWVLIGVILVAVIWGLVSAYSGKPATKTDYQIPASTTPEPMYEEPEPPRAYDWKDGAKTGVSKNFGKGGMPSGVSHDSGGVATSSVEDEDEWLKKAQPFEPRATKLNLEEDIEEVGEAT